MQYDVVERFEALLSDPRDKNKSVTRAVMDERNRDCVPQMDSEELANLRKRIGYLEANQRRDRPSVRGRNNSQNFNRSCYVCSSPNHFFQ